MTPKAVEQQMQSIAEVEGERVSAAANITEEGKTRIKSELQRLYPNYLPIASVPTMLDLNIDAVAKEIIQDK